jgi:hypothetical protein
MLSLALLGVGVVAAQRVRNKQPAAATSGSAAAPD